MRHAAFQIDCYQGEFNGVSDGEEWNGWACPSFTFDVAQQIVHAAGVAGQNASYDELRDEFAFQIDGDSEEERFGASEIPEIGKVYGIGKGCWIWEEAESSA